MRLKRLLSADLPTPYFFAAAEIDRPFEDLKSASAASIGVFSWRYRVFTAACHARVACARGVSVRVVGNASISSGRMFTGF